MGMKLILKYIHRHIAMFLGAIFFLTIEAMADLLQPAFMAHIVDDGVKHMAIRTILQYGLIMLGIALLGAFGAVMRNVFASYTSQKTGKEIRADLFQKIQELSLENIDRLQPASLITRITNDVTQIQDFVNGCMRILVKAPITCVGAVILVIVQTPQQISILIIILIISFSFVAANMKIGHPRFERLQYQLDRLNNVSREFLSSIRVVKAFGAEKQEEQKFEDASEALAKAGVSAMQVMAIFGPLINLTVNFGIVLLLWLTGNQKNTEIGRLMASVNYMTQILFAMGMISMILNAAVRATASAGRIGEVLNEVPAQKKGTESVTVHNKETAHSKETAQSKEAKQIRVEELTKYSTEEKGAVCFEQVSFSYAGAGKETLEQVSFSVKPGETIGIIGPTGSGKTTLVNLIPRFYDADSGIVRVNGMNVTNMKEEELRTMIAVVPQKAVLFSGTICENLRWGKKEATEEELKEAVRLACAESFIDHMEHGYDTLLGQGGVNLSGGQKQRLALARALIRRPCILILDDCTSALDARTEAAVLAGLREQLKDVTVLLISQRIATVRKADRILCMDNGKIQGYGSHEELMRTCSTYSRIFDSQIGGDGAYER